MKKRTIEERLATLEAQVRSLQIAQPGGIRLVERIEELERARAAEVARGNATPYLCANQLRSQRQGKER